ncbi:DUF3320 domain-containing protein [candidate division KSB1 bacterium]|nr:DUF3320 domain-containing protein [candidate division KSB1 bacterium]
MYKDLDSTGWPNEKNPSNHKVMSALLVNGFREPQSEYADDSHIDEIVSPKDVNQVKDADSSQILAMLDVNSGRNLVLQGPPGTGKSQTITNIIAESIGLGRKVLFVSEKMAALEVVKRRLDQVGLGEAVLELHSHKTNKKKVLEELNRTIHKSRPIIKDDSGDIVTLTQLRDKLNAYCDAVNKPIGNTSISFIRALGFAIKVAGDFRYKADFDFSFMQNWSESDYMSARMEVEVLDRYLAKSGPPANNPFRFSHLSEFLPSQRIDFERTILNAKKYTDELVTGANELAKIMSLRVPEKLHEVDQFCDLGKMAINAPTLGGLNLNSMDWLENAKNIVFLIKCGKSLSTIHLKYDVWLHEAAWRQNLVSIRSNFLKHGDKWWRFFSSDFRKARASLQHLCRKPLFKETKYCLVLVDAILDYQKHLKQFDQLSPLGRKLYGVHWKNEKSDWGALYELFKWIFALHQDVKNGKIQRDMIRFLSGTINRDYLSKQIEFLATKRKEQANAIASVEASLKLNFPNEIKTHWNLTMKRQSELLVLWHGQMDKLQQLVQYNQIASNISKRGMDFILPVAKNWQKGAGTLTTAFDFSWYNGLVEKAYRESQSIKMFDREQHEYHLEEFSRLDRLLFEYNRARLALMHWNSLPDSSYGEGIQMLNREFNKKRRHMPIRKLVEYAGDAIQAIKPVFMMSPMSIATYIPPAILDFDLVIFDEASQVKPVDAFGAILRGKQTLVVGDSKQLPPTNFFDSLFNSDEDEEFEDVGDMESILSLFLAKGAPERMLRWHYRSRHDSLIAVSNYEFYNNRLVVFPSPGINPKARGLRLVYLANTAYDKGKTRTNPEEARAVADAILKHALNHPELSLGVAAFSVAQRDAIELQLERLRRLNQTAEEFFSNNKPEPFFVKNLENVQGDERDVIMISIGYGKTAEGAMPMNFGPLNRDGGERRLNVLISRARLAMDVFSNFKASDLDLGRSNARGVQALKNFLAYAESGVIEQPYSTHKEPESPFEDAVIDKLVEFGFHVEPQVGTAGFFIDIAVKDPKKPGRYILGIECDGATYHSSRAARDRDRLRQEILEGLGWRIHRIWSTDWYRNPQLETERTLKAIQQAKEYFHDERVDPFSITVKQ